MVFGKFVLAFFIACAGLAGISTSARASPLEVFSPVSNNPEAKSIRVRLSFDDAQLIVGTYRKGYIKDTEHNYLLAPLGKYLLQVNASGAYDLFVIKDSKKDLLGSVSYPFEMADLTGDYPVYLGGHWYRGRIKASNSGIGPIMVNELEVDQLVWSLLSPQIHVGNSIGSIKAASIIMRSAILCQTLDRKDAEVDYDLSSFNLNYQGVDTEQDFVIRLIKESQSEVLVDAGGRLKCSPLKTAAVAGAFPFEQLGARTWEQVLTVAEAERQLMLSGVDIGSILGVEMLQAKPRNPSYPGQRSVVLSLSGSKDVVTLDLVRAKEIFHLPSGFFRVYILNNPAQPLSLQFLGRLNGGLGPETKVFNLVKSIELLSDPTLDYQTILREIYPDSYVARL